MSMLGVWIAIAACVAAVLYWVQQWFKGRSPAGGTLPPQPPGWPLLGNLALLVSKGRHRKIQQVGQQLGGIMTLKLGPQRSVWITSYDCFRDAVINHSWEFAGRVHESTVEFAKNRDKGIVMSGISEPEKEVRKFTLISLRSFGFGKSSMQETILHEADGLVEQFRLHCPSPSAPSAPFNPRTILANAAANVICSVLMGPHVMQQGDADFRLLSEDLTEAIKRVMIHQQAQVFPPLKLFLRKGIKESDKTFTKTFKFLGRVVQEHIDQHEAGVPGDFVDDWLDKAATAPDGTVDAARLTLKESGDKSTFRAGKLPTVLMDLFIGGFETTTTTFQWIFLMLLHYPEVQRKIHEELDRVVGRGGQQVTLEQRDELVYTEAVILETLRKYPLIPFAVPHMCTKDTKLNGYLIPQGTQVMLHIFSIHHDPALYPAPEAFRPERFINSEGRLSVPEHFVPFSAGRRSCIGEQLARKELFLFFANVLHNFRIGAPDPQRLPALTENDGIVMYPDPYEIVLHAR